MTLRRWLAGLSLLAASAVASACPICSGTARQSPAQELIDLPRAVLATPAGAQVRVLQVIKGERPEGVLNEVLRRDTAGAGQSLLLVRDDAWPMWVSLGAIDARHAGLLRELAVPRPAPADTTAWRRRVDLALPHLQSREPLLAEIAYAECASAPYAVLRAARPQLDPRMLRRWVDDPRLAARRPLYLLLLGIAGHAGDAAAIEARIDAAWRTHGVADLASLLAADLELRGPPRVAWIEERYLRDPSRLTAEVQAALLALSVQAHAGGAIPRERVIEAYRVFMRERKELAGLVAPDLAAWQHWEATPEFVALRSSGVRQQFASRLAIDAYLRQSPLAMKAD